jgi:predicted DNA-binding transcriptional regulator AlpA
MDLTMAQYFEQNNKRLDKIEAGLIAQKSVLNFDDFCKYTGISKSWGYKLTSQRLVPHYSPNNKTLYFEKVQIDNWLLQNPIKTSTELKAEIKGGAGK